MKHKISTSIFVSCLFAIFSLQAQEKTVHVSTGGTLASLLTADEIANTTRLVITTDVALADADFTFLNTMPKLKELDMSGDMNTTSFPANAFQNNATIETMQFPPKTSGFGGGAFNNCALKGVVSFPATITNPQNFTGRWDNTQGITAFAFPDNGDTHAIQAIDGVIVGWGNTLMKYPAGKENEEYTIPNGITAIAQQAFGDLHKLKKLIFSASVAQFNNEGATFRNTTSIEEFAVDPANATFSSTGGMLVKKTIKALFFFPPANKAESLVIDGSVVDSMAVNNFFGNAKYLKRIVFTEGFKTVGYTAFKPANLPSALEYVELPASTISINGEAFNGNANLTQIICKATTPPRLYGHQLFRDSNGKNLRLGVPAGSVDAYKASAWNLSLSGNPYGDSETYASINAIPGDQIVPYYTIAYEGAIAGLQDVSVAGYQVKITAGEGPSGQAFSGWASEPAGVQFINPAAATTYFTMPDNDLTIRATFAAQQAYVIIGATVSQSGQAAVGSSVNLETAAQKVENGNILYFQNWKINKGTENGLVIDNPTAVSTSFVMIAGEVEIEAVYKAAYMVNIQGGSVTTPGIEFFEGDVITITASNRPNQTFTNWSADVPEVVFADAGATTTTFVMPASEVNITANFRAITGIDAIALTKNVPYTLVNLSGIIVARGITNGETVSTGNLPAGAYILKTNNLVLKFIKR